MDGLRADISNSDQPTFLVFGLGAIGTYVGGSLALAGNKVIFIEQPNVAAFVRENGISLEIGGSNYFLKTVDVVTSIPQALAS